MLYVFDTSALRTMRFYFPTVFPTLWQQFDTLVVDGRLTSVREVLRECELQDLGDHLHQWIFRNKTIFAMPSDDEMSVVTAIFEIPHFRQLIQPQNLKLGRPVADPFLVACAKVKDACVVTQERSAENSARIPQVCDHFGVQWTNLEGFLAREGWRF